LHNRLSETSTDGFGCLGYRGVLADGETALSAGKGQLVEESGGEEQAYAAVGEASEKLGKPIVE
jgi:hypothetical protein